MTSSKNEKPRFPGYQRVVWTGSEWKPSDEPMPPGLVAWRATFKAPITHGDQRMAEHFDNPLRRLPKRTQSGDDFHPRQCGNR